MGLGHGADPPGDTLPSTARDGGLRGAGGIRIGSLSRGEGRGRNEQPQVIWETLEQVRRAISSSWGWRGLERLDLYPGGETGDPPPREDALLAEGPRPHLCSGSHGEPANVSNARNDMSRAVLNFSSRSSLNKPGEDV